MTEHADAAEALSDDDRATMLRPCACGHTINDHGSLAACWICTDEGGDCETDFETLLVQRVEVLVADRLAAREAAARAEALREAADAIYLNRPGQHNEGAKNWLHRRANLIDPRTRGSVCEHGYLRSVGCDYCEEAADSIARTDGAGS